MQGFEESQAAEQKQLLSKDYGVKRVVFEGWDIFCRLFLSCLVNSEHCPSLGRIPPIPTGPKPAKAAGSLRLPPPLSAFAELIRDRVSPLFRAMNANEAE